MIRFFQKSCLYLLLMLGLTTTTYAETVLVGGATGRQGNAVIDELLARGYEVRGMTRKPDGKKGQRLAQKGIEVVQGDYGDLDSLRGAMAGVDKGGFYRGFSMNEVAEGKNVIAAAKAAGIKHLVYSSGAAASPENGIPGAKKMEVINFMFVRKRRRLRRMTKIRHRFRWTIQKTECECAMLVVKPSISRRS